MGPVPDIAFVLTYAVAVVLVAIFTVQAARYWRAYRGLGMAVFTLHLFAKTAFMADLFLLRSVWLHSGNAIWGTHGWATFAIRVVWTVTLAIVVVIARRGGLIDHGHAAGPWNGYERRGFVRRAADRL